MMRPIAYVHYWGLPVQAASSVHVMKMCQAFQQANHPTTLYAPDEPNLRPSIDNIWHHFGVTTPFELKLMRPIPFLRKHDISLRAALHIRSKPNAISYGRNLAAMMWTSVFGVPTGLEIHDAPTNTQLTYLKFLINGRGFRRLIVISKPLKKLYIEKLGLPDDKIKVESDAVDIDRFTNLPSASEARQQLKLPDRQFTVGYAGSLYDGRGINLIIELARSLPDVHFLIVGGSPEQVDDLKRKLANQNTANMRFIGFVSNTQLPLYLAASDVLVMPYQKTIRTFGNVGDIASWISPMKMFEYMAAQRPIISSDLPVLREVLNEDNAILLPPDNKDEWINRIQQLRDEPAYRVALAQKARQDVAYYTWDKRVQRILQHLVE